MIKELKEKNEGLMQEVEKLKKFQETCMVILESQNIDPGKDCTLTHHSTTSSLKLFGLFLPLVVVARNTFGLHLLREEAAPWDGFFVLG